MVVTGMAVASICSTLWTFYNSLANYKIQLRHFRLVFDQFRSLSTFISKKSQQSKKNLGHIFWIFTIFNHRWEYLSYCAMRSMTSSLGSDRPSLPRSLGVHMHYARFRASHVSSSSLWPYLDYLWLIQCALQAAWSFLKRVAGSSRARGGRMRSDMGNIYIWRWNICSLCNVQRNA